MLTRMSACCQTGTITIFSYWGTSPLSGSIFKSSNHKSFFVLLLVFFFFFNLENSVQHETLPSPGRNSGLVSSARSKRSYFPSFRRLNNHYSHSSKWSKYTGMGEFLECWALKQCVASLHRMH